MSDNNIAPEIQEILWERVKQYNRSTFIDDDPISIPHRFSQKKDIEISAFFAATLAWGQRKTIIKSTNTLMSLFDNAPFDFISHVTESEIEGIPKFVHRTFNTEDLKFFIRFFKRHYAEHESLEAAFFPQRTKEIGAVKLGLIHFHDTFFEGHLASRTKKHVSTPSKNSACKRLNMFLRWMVRKKDNGVDFELWQNIKPYQLICPIDTHVGNIASQLGLISLSAANWQQAIALTEVLKGFSATDPVQYDFALFGLGIEQRRTGFIPQLKY